MFLQQNLAFSPQALARVDYLPRLAQQLSAMPLPHIPLAEDTQGAITVQADGIWLHNAQDVLAEVSEAVHTLITPGERRVHVVIGLGMGYLLQAVAQASPGRIVVYEPNLPLLRFVLEHVQLAPWLTDPRVTLATNPAELEQAVRQVIVGRELDITVLPGTVQWFAATQGPEVFDSLASQLYTWESQARTDWNSYQRFHKLWVQRFFENQADFPLCRSLSELAGIATGEPAILVSRGPSLDEAIPALNAFQGHARIIAVGGALRPLLRAGIRPDLTLFMDAQHQRLCLENLRLPTDDLVFGVSPITEPVVYQTPARARYLMLFRSLGPMAAWLDPNGREPRLPGAWSVSLFAWQLARWMGCEPLILVGQDLALRRDGQQYCDKKMARAVQGRESGKMFWVAGKGGVRTSVGRATEIMGQDGEPLPTLESYALFARELEAYLTQVDRPARAVNASIGGAYLEGFEHQSLEALWQSQSWPELPPLRPLDTPAPAWADAHKLRVRVKNLSQAVHDFSQAARRIGEASARLRNGTGGAPALAAYQAGLASVEETLKANPMLAHMTLGDRYALDQRLDVADHTEALLAHTAEGHHAMAGCLGQCLTPHLNHALDQLAESPSTPASPSVSG